MMKIQVEHKNPLLLTQEEMLKEVGVYRPVGEDDLRIAVVKYSGEGEVRAFCLSPSKQTLDGFYSRAWSRSQKFVKVKEKVVLTFE